MEFFLNRYRNLSVLLVAILAQLGLLAYQIKSSSDVRLIRVWAVTAVTPLARLIEGGRSGVSGFFHDYFVLLDVREENKRLRADLDKAQLDNQYLRAELSTADRAQALALFQKTSQAKTLAARVIGNTTDVGGSTVFVDRGAASGVHRGMGVTTPEGIVGKVIEVFPTASSVLLITDPSFAASVVSQNNHTHGVVKGKDNSSAIVDYVQNEQKVDPGEEFLTSGEDRVFPKGYLVGQATVVRAGVNKKEIFLTPSGMQNGLEDVLIILDNTPGPAANAPAANQSVQLLPAPLSEDPQTADAPGIPAPKTGLMTDLDRVAHRDEQIGAAQNHKFGDKNSPAPNFNITLPATPPAAPAAAPRP